MINTLWALMILYINLSNFQTVSSDLDQLYINPSTEITAILDLKITYEAICAKEQTTDQETFTIKLEELLTKSSTLQTKLKKSLVQIKAMNSHLFLTAFEALYYAYHKSQWERRYRYSYDNDLEYMLSCSNELFTITNGSMAGLITAHKYFYESALSKQIKSLDDLILMINKKLNNLP